MKGLRRGVVIGSICTACVVVLLAVCAGVYGIQARKRRRRLSAPVMAVPAQYPVVCTPDPDGGGSAVGSQTDSAQYPVAHTDPTQYPVAYTNPAQYPVAHTDPAQYPVAA